MCGRYTLRRIDISRWGLHVTLLPDFEEFVERPRFNIAPSQDVAAVRLNAEGKAVLGPVKWGLIPHWCKQTPDVQPINARCETVCTSGMFKQALARRRCLIPADGFYEWKKLDGKNKQPYFIHYPDDRTFAFAGLWERWQPPGECPPMDTCTIVTTTANSLMAPLHERMPVILAPEQYRAWLDRDTETAKVLEMLRPCPDGDLEAVPVSSLVNSPKNDSPDCVAPQSKKS